MFYFKFFKILFLNFFCCGILFCCVQSPTPIIYHPKYEIRFDELKEFVDFRYRKIYDKWLIRDRAKAIYEYFKNKKNVKIFEPESWVQDKDLLVAHSKKYIESFDVLENIRDVIRFKFDSNNLPEVNLLQQYVLFPARYAIAGTILGVSLALKYGCAINSGGGFHHAGISSGGGFCFFNDIAIAALKLLEINKDKKDFKILIVDLDAHWGNGTQEILGSNKQVFIFDVFNEDRQLFKGTPKDKDDHFFNFPVPENTNTQNYLEIVKTNLTVLVNKIKPDFIIYNAGLDVLDGDALGGLRVSAKGIIERDSFVFNLACQHKIPILMVLSGGYTDESIDVIKQSICKICGLETSD